jgi:hypothetical protein
LLFLATFQNTVETTVSSLLIARCTNNNTNFSLKTDLIFFLRKLMEIMVKAEGTKLQDYARNDCSKE